MKRNTIRWVVIFAAISIIGIIVIQIYWVSRAYDLREKQFSHRVNLALTDVAEKVNNISLDSSIIVDPVSQLGANHYIVDINEPVNLAIIEAYLTQSFMESDVETDFEYGVYDCVADTLIIGDYMKLDSAFAAKPNRSSTYPEFISEQSYFGVYFPRIEASIFSQISFWIFSSLILAIVIIFFSYTTFIILRQRKMSEITRDFINNMTHEFKTPISTIALSSEVILKVNNGDNSDRINKYAHIIQSENRRLQKQVEKVLQVATLEKEDLTLHKESVDIHEIIRKALGSIHLALDEKQGVVKTELKAIPFQLKADRVHLTNIIYNLIDNAIKYSGKTDPNILIETGNYNQGIVISIKDSGIGINPADLKHIFKKFYRVSTGNRHDVKGFGLGLSYVKMMVDKHRGQVSVTSEQGKGTEIKIQLPYK